VVLDHQLRVERIKSKLLGLLALLVKWLGCITHVLAHIQNDYYKEW
jgi:hypothetical protein